MSLPLVLIVDDNPENLTVIGELLQPQYAVRAANSGARGLRLAGLAPQPDLILLDVMMPEMDGFEVLRQLQSDPETAHIPVVFLTALNTADDEERGLMRGAVDYITKPIRPPILLARVRTQLELKQARDQLRQHHQHLQDEVARQLDAYQRVQDATIQALVRLAEVRGVETGNHLLRTQAYMHALASQLGADTRFADRIDAQQISLLTRSAPLHDIGQVGVPDGVLLKPGRLSPDEFELMKSHARIGAEAIAAAEPEGAEPMAVLQCAKLIARSHHERWDGGGYPDGLAGEAIPLPARLMALADVYDALVSHRVYKLPLSHADACRLIVSERGRHFDPAVVDAFVLCSETLHAITRRFADPPRGRDWPEGAAAAAAGA